MFFQIYNGAGREDRDAKPVDDRFLDAFQIVHSGDHIEVRRRDADLFQKKIHLFLGAGAFFTDDDRIFQKLFEIDRIFLEFQVVFCDRRGDHEGILTERNKDTAFISGILPDKCKIDSSVQNAVDRSLTVRLDGMKINIRVEPPKPASSSGNR